jgi:hypothetical protein
MNLSGDFFAEAAKKHIENLADGFPPSPTVYHGNAAQARLTAENGWLARRMAPHKPGTSGGFL